MRVLASNGCYNFVATWLLSILLLKVTMPSPVYSFVATSTSHQLSRTDYQTSLIISFTVPTSKEEVETFRKPDFISAIAEKTGMNKKESEAALMAVVNVIMEQVGQGKKVSIPTFGTFTLKERAARKGRNPQTGEPLDIAASKSPSFSVAKAWKDSVNSPKS